MATKKITDSEFEQSVLKSEQPVLVDFWAEWCGPCRQLAPILDDVASEMEGKVTIAKVNIEDSPEAPQRYGVRGIPTMILFKNGQPVATKVGALPKTQLVEWLQNALAS